MRVLITGGSGFIGTNLVDLFLRCGVEFVNLDWNPPLDVRQQTHWREADILDREAVERIFLEFHPQMVVHLAARADTDEKEDLRGYLQNHEGTRRLLEVVKTIPGVERIVVTSTQFVCEAGYQPRNDTDFKPFTLYGESKRLTELATREAGLSCAWTIIRPTTIWGPWSLRYRDIMLKVMRKRLYFHPASGPVIRSYGYVGNVTWQIQRILELPLDKVSGKIFYVGDRPFDLRSWVDAVSTELTGRPARTIPAWLVRGIASVGDILKVVGMPFPMNSGRYKSMTSDYFTPMDDTIRVLGEAPFDLQEGVRAFITWYRERSGQATPHVLKDTRTKPPAERP